ncbi:MAG: GTP 3',8-cyclase MoaA [Bacteroidia bacterium]
MLTDAFNRVHNYLRISLTDRCNFRCTYCLPDDSPGAYQWMSNLMTADEIVQIAKVFTDLGVTKIRLTGGEPLVRKDAGDIMLRLSELPVKLTLTTNGVRADEFLSVFRKAGIHSLNVSLDSLNREVFRNITQRDQFDRVIQNIHLLSEERFHLKLNMVVMKGINEQEIPAFIALTRDKNIHVRFIEYMPFAKNHWENAKVVGETEILDWAKQYASIEKLNDDPGTTARAWRADGHAGTFAIISTMTHPFCSSCNRLRLTADGKMKNCLFSAGETDLLSALRRGHPVEPLIRQNLMMKAAARGGQMDQPLESLDPELMKNRSMIAIGG